MTSAPSGRSRPTLATRYLEIIKRSLLNDLYAELEGVLHYLLLSRLSGEDVDPAAVRDIAHARPDILAHIAAVREEGTMVIWPATTPGGAPYDPRNLSQQAHTLIGRRRLDHLHQCLDTVLRDDVPGDLIETGVWRGGATIFMRAHLAAHDIRDRVVWVADSFQGLPSPSCVEDRDYDLSVLREPILAIDQSRVAALFERYGLLDEQVRFLPGWFRDSLAPAPIEALALLRLDGDLYESTMDALTALYDRVSPGGFIVIDDYGVLPPCRGAVDAFRAARGIDVALETIDASGVAWRKPPQARAALRGGGAVAAPKPATTWVPPGHFYSPIVDPAALRSQAESVFDPDAPVAAIDLRIDAQAALLRTLARFYGDLPFADLPRDGLRYGYVNDSFSYADAILRACMIRHFRPRRIVEVGAGHSSCVTLDVNERFFDNGIECSFIDPHPELLRRLVRPDDRYKLFAEPVQEVDPAVFEALEAGDFLLVDSTHVSKAGSDVNHHFFRILPGLAAGVIVFFHDVFYPFEYPREWFFDENRSWNELYLLRAFLSYNPAFEILLFTGALEHREPGLLAELMPLAANNPGGSFWMRRVDEESRG